MYARSQSACRKVNVFTELTASSTGHTAACWRPRAWPGNRTVTSSHVLTVRSSSFQAPCDWHYHNRLDQESHFSSGTPRTQERLQRWPAAWTPRPSPHLEEPLLQVHGAVALPGAEVKHAREAGAVRPHVGAQAVPVVPVELPVVRL